ncbi:sulfotransferase domain-containing protein [Paracoccus sp. S-4012]|uniref:sulfotransferase domain-containing protein n=1 Tax=Paracoccus sp. S-4012 TaxID=2665648 RepID=UPI002105B506|nr:sulfotransferase domain-containing protein [Paracoccus sp. S-4012]
MEPSRLPRKVPRGAKGCVVQECRVGLYSFPKCGNTWLRAIVAAMVGIPQQRDDLQNYLTDIYQGVPYEHSWDFQGRRWYFYKAHHNRVLDRHEGRPLATDKVIYIYRHPLDAFLSYLNFASAKVAPQAGDRFPIAVTSVDELSAEEMEVFFGIFLEHGTLLPHVEDYGSIFEHARHFIDLAAGGEAVHVLRYEDLSRDFETEARRIAGFLGLDDIDPDRVFEAAEARTRKNGRFFWKRKVENYRNYLTDAQIARFEARYAPELRRLGYGRDPAAPPQRAAIKV